MQTRDDLRAGDDAVIVQGGKHEPVVVTKANRVWLTVVSKRVANWEWKVRRDNGRTTNDPSKIYFSMTVLKTIDMVQADLDQANARKYLKEQGVVLRQGSPWAGREEQLAAALKAYVGQQGIEAMAEDNARRQGATFG